MNGKSWWQSATVISVIVMFAFGLAQQIFGVEPGSDPSLQDDTVNWLLMVGQAVAGGVAIWGRIRATKAIGAKSGQTWMNLLLVGLMLAAAGGCASVSESYLAADRATFGAVAPEYSSYVQADPALTAEQRERRQRTIETWRLRLEAGTPATQPGN